ncbi:ribosome biogenesis GTPase Der [Helicobacter winghamensis]|uniref:GTPase Der n=1 Tax=Helicobacter winghamensis TaxID=157268 RepID=A0A2N3PJP8_9HELI|nr:ribosome biogenesis GTPase Der [Helicobacter winghamensis]EEO26218.1 ribosome biogenesis GTPase Der [Helicobacter winghamensis ATCC BAA-430]PKT77215.1 ribosome biogenesis GTPase Der [Helicobacter winghamensis]PKT77414.1 ribosome biogenesis GTPase Der [Helicobacter winghamensis]PKT77852.1 ribosome biogenesis GTPase Der [Helicobacter winghamensis]PKT81380.1 ribosome biogenesis GTPase Der [Helicobacter winghamensis]
MDKVYGSIAIVGRPNAGKSSLFNRFCKQRIAITSEIAGTTRDVKKARILLQDLPFLLFDTGGLDDKDALFQSVSKHSQRTGESADLILYLVDGKTPPEQADKEIFYSLEKKNPNIFLVINKIDNDKEKQNAWEFMEFGAKNVFYISVAHNRGILELEKAIVKALKNETMESLIKAEFNDESLEDFLENETEKTINELINIGIIGRVNVGKSSLLNALLKEERSVVSNVAGTTIDPVDEIGEINGRRVNFVDTAGIRRRGKIEGLEKFALNRTRTILERTDIAILVLDASVPFVELDEKIAGLIDEFKLGVIVVFNKWDIAHKDFKGIMEDFKLRFKFLEYAPILTISAKNGRHIQKLEEEILRVYANFSFRIPTAKLNATIKEATMRHPLPSDHGKIVKIYYATQFESKPPQIALIMNRPNSLHFSYKRYLVNFLRERFDFSGTRVIFIARGKNDFDEQERE